MWYRSGIFGSILGSIVGLGGINAFVNGINIHLFGTLVMGFIFGGLVGAGITLWGSKRPVISGMAFTAVLYGIVMAAIVVFGGGGGHLHSVISWLAVVATTLGIGAMSGVGYKILSTPRPE